MSSNMPLPNKSDFAVAKASSYQQHDKQNIPSPAATTIPDKFKGTRNDQNDMVLLGKKQVLRRNFKFTSILGFASTGRYC
jgi:choline transport protein